ncbi:MAG TPA: ABC transporter ATP-binding protein [Anaerolineales bacterium]|nr:ABC transporter ATP-binding protein [Anaerolineales bacterium]
MRRRFEAATEEAPAALKEPQQAGPPAIVADKASHRFAGDAGVYDLTFQVPRGVIFGLIGPSGCGKTTTVRILTGMYKPSSGNLTVLGEQPWKFTSSARGKIGYMPQQFVLYPMLSVGENFDFSAALYGLGAFHRAHRRHQLLKFVELNQQRHRITSKLSGGMQRRLQLACALAHDPELIFADEPTAGVDPVLRAKFWEHFRELRNAGKTLFVTTQYVGEAENCDLVGIMRGGRLLYIDTPQDLRRKAFGGDLIRIVVDADRAREAAQLLNGQNSVKDARQAYQQSGLLLVSTDDAASTLPELVTVLRDHGIDVRESEQYASPFDEVFLELVKREGE